MKTPFIYKPNLKKRILATIIDYGLYILIFIAWVEYFGTDDPAGGKSVHGLLALPIFIYWFIYFVVIESIFGATLGHLGFDLKVLTMERRNIRLGNAFKRHLLDPIDILFYGIPAVISIKKSDKHQRIGDMFANTIVVDISDPEQF